MNRLTLIQSQKAVEFLMSGAQDIDKAMHEYFFEGLPLDDVVRVLQSYQNEEVWERVCKRLKGVLTMKFLWTLKKFDRIETN